MNQAGNMIDRGPAARLRDELTDMLIADGKISSPVVEKAFRTVPRELFVPDGTPLEATYSVDHPVVTKTDEHGAHVSSVSATYIQARMIEMADIRTGMTVLEVGSGGYNAALLAEVVGPSGHVVSVDIDPEIAGRARELLAETGYGDRVTVLEADGDHPIAEGRLVDRMLITVGAWDISPAWLEQLTSDGVLVVPLRMNGITRTIAFRRDGDHLASTDVEVAGFVPMRGAAAHAERTFLLPESPGNYVRLQFDSDVPETINRLDSVLTTDPITVWSGVTIGHGISFADLHLWLAARVPGFCRIVADPGTAMAAEAGRTWFPFGAVQGDSFAYLTVRPAPGLQGGGVEFGVTAYGLHGHTVGAAFVEQIQAWDRQAREVEPAFAYWPAGSDRTQIPGGAAVMNKQRGAVSISWPRTDST